MTLDTTNKAVAEMRRSFREQANPTDLRLHLSQHEKTIDFCWWSGDLNEAAVPFFECVNGAFVDVLEALKQELDALQGRAVQTGAA